MADTAALDKSRKIQTLRQSPASPQQAAFEAGSVAGTVELREVPFLTMAGLRVDPGSEAGSGWAPSPAACPPRPGSPRQRRDRGAVAGSAEFLLVAPAEAHESLAS